MATPVESPIDEGGGEVSVSLGQLELSQATPFLSIFVTANYTRT